jgi:hypothetical protein
MKNVTKLGVIALAAGMLVTSLSVAYADEAEQRMPSEERQAQHQVVQDAIANGDYETFSSHYLERTGEELSESSFDKIVQIHQLREELREEGVKMFKGKKGPHKGGQKRGERPQESME